MSTHFLSMLEDESYECFGTLLDLNLKLKNFEEENLKLVIVP